MQFSFPFFLKNNRLALLLIGIASLFYIYILNSLGGMDFVKTSLYFTGDSLEYKDYAHWLSGEIDYCNPYRTFFYPLVILISEKLFGYYGIWIFQFVFWLGACLMVFKTALRLSGRTSIAILSFLLACSSISLIVYTAHALTEITTFFFLSLFMYVLSFAYRDFKKPIYFLSLLLVISVLASLKPVFQMVWYLGMLSVLIVNFKSIIRRPVLLLLIILASSPVIIQSTINKIEHNTFSNTKIADYNLHEYFYRKIKFVVEEGSYTNYDYLPDSVHVKLKAEAARLDKSDVVKFILNHPMETVMVYWDNVNDNLRAGNPYITRESSRSLSKWVVNTTHNFLYFIHLFMPIIWTFYLIKRFRKNNKESHLIFASGIVLFYILYSSGITYWAGDRLLVPARAIWSVLYPLLIFKIILNSSGSRFESTSRINKS